MLKAASPPASVRPLSQAVRWALKSEQMWPSQSRVVWTRSQRFQTVPRVIVTMAYSCVLEDKPPKVMPCSFVAKNSSAFFRTHTNVWPDIGAQNDIKHISESDICCRELFFKSRDVRRSLLESPTHTRETVSGSTLYLG